MFDEIIAHMISNRKLNPIVTILFSRCRKLNLTLVFTIQSYFKVTKDARLNSTHYFTKKFLKKQEQEKSQLIILLIFIRLMFFLSQRYDSTIR